jgi:VWFA-related protein
MVLMALVPTLVLAAEPTRDQTFTETTEVIAVEVPVQVVLDGKPVRGLTAANFIVYQDKKKEPVTGFETVDLYTIPEDKAAEVPAPARRHFLLLFDLSFSEPRSVVKARDAATGLLDELHASDLVAVATYTASRGPELVLGFTPDRAQASAAIDTLGLPELVDRTQTDPLRIVVDALKSQVETTSQTEAGLDSKRAGFDAMLLEQLEGFLQDSERATRLVEKDKVTALARSFTDLARLMRTVSGRKYVVYLSEGYDSSLVTGTPDGQDQTEMRTSADTGALWKVDSEKRFGSSAVAGEVESMLQELRRADCVVQAVDIGGLRGGTDSLAYERKNGKESLFQMAHDTGGELYENFNDLGAAMGTMLERTGVTYVLTIEPPVAPDGAYHNLRVELKRGPRGARVVHRPGYYAPKPFAQRSRYEKMLATAGDVLLGEEGGTVRLTALTAALPAGPATGGSAKIATSDVLVMLDVDGPSLLHLNQGEDLPVEIYVYAMDDKGRVRDFVAQTLSLDLFKLERRLLETGLKFYGHLELPPGSYKARVLVRNGRTGLHGLKVLPLEVQPSVQAGMLPAAFYPDAKTSWLIVREAPRPGRRETPLPARPAQPVP